MTRQVVWQTWCTNKSPTVSFGKCPISPPNSVGKICFDFGFLLPDFPLPARLALPSSKWFRRRPYKIRFFQRFGFISNWCKLWPKAEVSIALTCDFCGCRWITSHWRPTIMWLHCSRRLTGPCLCCKKLHNYMVLWAFCVIKHTTCVSPSWALRGLQDDEWHEGALPNCHQYRRSSQCSHAAGGDDKNWDTLFCSEVFLERSFYNKRWERMYKKSCLYRVKV